MVKNTTSNIVNVHVRKSKGASLRRFTSQQQQTSAAMASIYFLNPWLALLLSW
jgi:hypothetical protein